MDAPRHEHPKADPKRLRRVLMLLLLGTAALSIFTLRPPEPPPPSTPLVVQRDFLTPREGRLWRAGQGQPFTGFMVEHYPDGVLKSRSAVSDGVLHGVSEGWYPNGGRQVREHFVLGVSHGLREKWHANGRLWSRATIEEGKLNGEFKRWDEAGNLAETLLMKSGEPDGDAVAFHPSGFLKVVARFERGRMMDQRFFSDGERREMNTERKGARQ